VRREAVLCLRAPSAAEEQRDPGSLAAWQLAGRRRRSLGRPRKRGRQARYGSGHVRAVLVVDLRVRVGDPFVEVGEGMDRGGGGRPGGPGGWGEEPGGGGARATESSSTPSYTALLVCACCSSSRLHFTVIFLLQCLS
jgi:hypothetical protein